MHRQLIPSLLILCACASQAPPGGGPEDKTAPVVEWTLPASDSIRVDRSTRVEIAFSERMHRNSTELAIFISPLPDGEIEYRWKKNVLTMTFDMPFPPNRTCVITVGTDAKDLHGNGMAASYSFAFSTGDSIDRGEIGGRVFAEQGKNVSIWAYRLDQGVLPDDSLPLKKRADYITQIGRRGEYKLSYLAPAKYRVFAVIDTDEDHLYSPAIDAVGIPKKDVDLGAMTFVERDLDFYLAVEDTAVFAPLTLVGLDPHTLRSGFSRALSKRYFENSGDVSLKRQIILIDSVTARHIPIRDVLVHSARPSEVFILLDDSLPNGVYRCVFSDIVSAWGENSGNRTVQAFVEPAGRSFRPTLVWMSPDPSSRVLPSDLVTFHFEGAVMRQSLEASLKIIDTNNILIRGAFDWWNATRLDFWPHETWKDQMTYRLAVDSSLSRDWQGRPLLDTTFRARFTTFRRDSLGTLTGKIIDESHSRGIYVINCRPLQKSNRLLRVVADSNLTFRITELVAGRYLLDGYHDADGNDQYSFGKVAPIRHAERFAVYSDTLVIRPNWETSNVILRFK